jgi:hypothetical protein
MVMPRLAGYGLILNNNLKTTFLTCRAVLGKIMNQNSDQIIMSSPASG